MLCAFEYLAKKGVDYVDYTVFFLNRGMIIKYIQDN